MALLGLLSKLNVTILCLRDGIAIHIPQLFSSSVKTYHRAKSIFGDVEFVQALSTISGIK